MDISFSSGVFFAKASWENKDQLREAGFKWHRGQCSATGCKVCRANLRFVWWTDRAPVAVRFEGYCDAYAKAALDSHRKRVEASRATSAEIEIPAPVGKAYRPYQKAGIAFALPRSTALIADEQGLGKSIQSLGVINADPSIRRVLVVCPPNLRTNWLREAQEWLTRQFVFHIVEGNSAIPQEADFVICGYSKLTEKETNKVLESLLVQEWDLVIADEAQYLTNPKAQRTVAVCGSAYDSKDLPHKESRPGLVSRARKVLFLTGTPLTSAPINLWPILSATRIAKFGSFMQYVNRYCNAKSFKMKDGTVRWDFNGASNLDELNELLRSTIMIRRLKRDVLSELPPKIREIIRLPSSEDLVFRPSEGVASKLEALRIEGDAARKKGDFSALKAIANKMVAIEKTEFGKLSKVRKDLALRKVPFVVEHVRDLIGEGSEKIVVFIHHHATAAALKDAFGDEAVVFTGETPDNEKVLAVDRFQTDPGVKVFIGAISAAGVGLNLTAATNVVFAELSWSPSEMLQAEDRCHRIGTKTSVLMQTLVFDRGLDMRMAEVLVKKQEIIENVLDLDVVSGVETSYDLAQIGASLLTTT